MKMFEIDGSFKYSAIYLIKALQGKIKKSGGFKWKEVI